MEYYCQKDNDEQVMRTKDIKTIILMKYFQKFEDYIVKAFSESKLEKFDDYRRGSRFSY